MKDTVVIMLIFAMLLFATPVAHSAFVNTGAENVDKPVQTEQPPHRVTSPDKVTLALSGGSDRERIIVMSVEEYLTGCLFAQISLDYHEQALKAQAIAAHTYLLKLISDRQNEQGRFTSAVNQVEQEQNSIVGSVSELLTAPLITDNPETCQPYFTTEAAEAHYGSELYNEYLPKVRAAAKYGASRVITYDGEPIYAVYHSISAGVTNTAQGVWGYELPYLQSVDSSWDRTHPNYLCTNEFTADSIRTALYKFNANATLPVDATKWFVNPLKNEFGYVQSVRVGDCLLSGGDSRRIFGFRSVAFDVSYRAGDIFVVESRGFGHGVGLSQYGANILAGRGFSCEEILLHYYSGVEIIKV